LIQKIINIPRIYKQIILAVIDSIVILSSIIASFSLRLGEFYSPEGELLYALLVAPILGIGVFYKFGLYKNLTRFIDLKITYTILKAVALYAVFWTLIAVMFEPIGIPRSILIINISLLFILTVVIRLSIRKLLHLFANRDSKFNISKKSKRILIYGADEVGIAFVELINKWSKYKVIGFIDTNKDLYGSYIKGLKVISPGEIDTQSRETIIDEIYISAKLSTLEKTSLFEEIKTQNIAIKVMPNIFEIIEEGINLSDTNKFTGEDLLGREVIKPKKELLSKNIFNKVVCVTGAGGSIGSEICRQVANLGPKRILLVDISEVSLYKIDQELRSRDYNIEIIIPLLGDTSDKVFLKQLFKTYKIDTIYHAAAYKHVPLVESNPLQGFKNNFYGTLNLANKAVQHNVETFVMISTDKAVRPTNIMGASKRISELALISISNSSKKTKFSIVRFGNVLNSSGSVIPLFKKQIKNGGPITVTDKNMIRYFMVTSEAVELVIQAGAMTNDIATYFLDMGKPVKIYELAKKMVALSGLSLKNSKNLNGDIEIIFTGLRPGEKLFEELSLSDSYQKTQHPLIMKANEEEITYEQFNLLEKDISNSLGEIEKLKKILRSSYINYN